MQIVNVLFLALLSISGTIARPMSKLGQNDVSIQATGPALDSQDQQFQPVHSPPKTVSARSNEDDDSGSSLHERGFVPVSPPPKVLPPPELQVKERGFDPVSPPPKVLPPRRSALEKRTFEPFSPPPKVLPPPSSDGESRLSSARKRPFDPISPPPKVAPPQYHRRDGFVTVMRLQA